MKTVLRNSILFLLMASMLLGVAACAPKPDPNADTTVAPDTTEQPTESDTPEETESETESPYLIPDPTRIDLSTLPEEVMSVTFVRPLSTDWEACEQGVKFIGRGESRDPSVTWQISSMYEAAGYPASADGKTYVP